MPLPGTCQLALTNAEQAVSSFTGVAETLSASIAAFAAEQWAVGFGLLVAAYEEARIFSVAGAAALNNAIACIRNFLLGIGITFGGGGNVACATTHKTSVVTQGPGVCCAAFQASGLTPAVGVRVAAVNKLGKCIICEVKASTSKKNPGVLVFKRGKASVPGSSVACPSTAEGCCALAGLPG